MSLYSLASSCAAAHHPFQARDGVLFIDEAYQLDPSSPGEGRSIVNELLTQTENNREHLTVILAGYKEDIQTKLMAFNSGFPSRFPIEIKFDDYSEDELKAIFVARTQEMRWHLETEEVAMVAARRLARGIGRKGFGNARDVRNLFERAQKRAQRRLRSETGQLTVQQMTTLTKIDVLGKRPEPERSVAVQKLERMVGLRAVKQSVRDLMRLAVRNYDREMKGERVDGIALNRLFLGNPGNHDVPRRCTPGRVACWCLTQLERSSWWMGIDVPAGTGKTTVSMIYGQILADLGFLSKGDVVCKRADELVGDVVGATQTKIQALLKECEGKVLVIDEAYSLTTIVPYGPSAVDALVGGVQGRPGEDIAVIMCGYEDKMREMLRTMNPGLSSRFQLEDALRFEDYNNEELRELLKNICRDKRIGLSRAAADEAVRILGQRRSMPQFGNAREIDNLVSEALKRMMRRVGEDAEPRGFEPEDFSPGVSPEGVAAALGGMQNIEHILEHFDELRVLARAYRREGKEVKDLVLSYTFTGKAGTGKTSVARKMAEIYHQLELLPTNRVIEVKARDLQAPFVGQTTPLVNDKMQAARGGVLFIDEAYGLHPRNGQFAMEAYEALLACLTSPEYEGNVIVILAGYEPQINDLLNANEGMRSRFKRCLDFADWDTEAVCRLIEAKAGKEVTPIRFSAEALDLLAESVSELKGREGWANARDAVSIYRELSNARMLRRERSGGASSPDFETSDVDRAVRDLLRTRPRSASPGAAPPVPLVTPVPVPMTQFMAPPQAAPVTRAAVEAREAVDERHPDILAKAEAEDATDTAPSAYESMERACAALEYTTERVHAILETRDFPDELVAWVGSSTGQSPPQVIAMLRQQVPQLLPRVTQALETQRQLAEQQRKREEEELHRRQEEERRLRAIMDAARRQREQERLEQERRQREEARRRQRQWVCSFCHNSNPGCPYRATRSGGYYVDG